MLGKSELLEHVDGLLTHIDEQVDGLLTRIDEQQAEIDALRGKAIAYDLDRAGIEGRNAEAVELVELRAERAALRTHAFRLAKALDNIAVMTDDGTEIQWAARNALYVFLAAYPKEDSDDT